MKLGRTIAGGRETVESEFARQSLLKKREQKKRVQLFLLGSVIIATVITSIVLIQGAVKKVPVDNQERGEIEKYIPTVEMVDEDGSDYITERMKQYIGMMERDAKDSNLKVLKVIIPTGKAREVDVYFEGRNEFYKCNLDRGTAESLEDILRMIEYLKKNAIEASYVDVRLEGRAYFKTK